MILKRYSEKYILKHNFIILLSPLKIYGKFYTLYFSITIPFWYACFMVCILLFRGTFTFKHKKKHLCGIEAHGNDNHSYRAEGLKPSRHKKMTQKICKDGNCQQGNGTQTT